MFGVGWTEMLLVGIVALVVIGPKDLPVVMGRLGKMVATIRRLGGEFQREINKTTGLDTITDLRRSITEPLKQTAAEITREFNKTTPTGAVEPSGAIAPKEPGSESVVEEIRAQAGMSPITAGPIVAPAVMAAAATVESPGPVETIVPIEAAAPKPRKPRAKKAPVAPAPIEGSSTARRALAKEAAAAAPVPEMVAETPKPKVTRKRTPKPKTEA
jgi:sec-independent protein translocase protein TatB